MGAAYIPPLSLVYPLVTTSRPLRCLVRRGCRILKLEAQRVCNFEYVDISIPNHFESKPSTCCAESSASHLNRVTGHRRYSGKSFISVPWLTKNLLYKFRKLSTSSTVSPRFRIYGRTALPRDFVKAKHQYQDSNHSIPQPQTVSLCLSNMSNCRCEPVLEGVAKLAEHPLIIGVTYGVFALCALPGKNCISEKWRTIRKTRSLGYTQMVISTFPLPLFVFYAALQGMAGDNKEMMAALVGFLVLGKRGLMQLAGDAYRLMQLNAYQRWCSDLLDRMKSLGMEGNKQMALMRVNNTVVDYAMDSAVTMKRFKWMYSRFHRDPSRLLTTGKVESCTVRWGGAFLSTFGDIWGGKQDGEYLQELFTSCKTSLSSLDTVTFLDKGARVRMIDLINSQKGIGAYGSKINLNGIQIMSDLKKRTSELEDLMNDYPYYPHEDKPKNHPFYPSIELVHAILFSKAIEKDTLRALKEYSSMYAKSGNPSGWPLYLWQNEELPVDNDKGFLDRKRIPLFPWQYLMVPLWDKCTNWRVLQATAHKDNKFKIFVPENYSPPQTTPPCCFEYTRRLIVENSHHYTEFRFSGSIMETVRSFLATWLHKRGSNILKAGWAPEIDTEQIEFQSKNEPADLKWECQCFLQERIVNMERNEYLPGSRELIMLFILSFPCGHLPQNSVTSEDPSDEEEVITLITNDDSRTYQWDLTPQSINMTERAIPMNLNNEERTNFSAKSFGTVIAPQDIKVLVKVMENKHNDERTISMQIFLGKGVKKFIWEDWINAAMGFIKGLEELDTANTSHVLNHELMYRRTPSTANLCNPVMMMSIPPFGEKRHERTPLWTGWPIFNIKVTQFEITEWFRAVGTRPFPYEVPENEVILAERRLLKEVENWLQKSPLSPGMNRLAPLQY